MGYCNDEHFRRRILVQLNRGEGRDGLSRDVCHGRRGELRQPYREGQEEQLGALGLIVNTIVLYNTMWPVRNNGTGSGAKGSRMSNLPGFGGQKPRKYWGPRVSTPALASS